MSLHLFHNFVRVSAVFNQPKINNLNLHVKDELNWSTRRHLERLMLGATTISQRCTGCDKRRIIVKPGDLTDIE